MEELYDPNHGTKCLLIRYDSEETGVLRADGGTQDILFHLNQLWLWENESWIQWREVHPSSGLAARFPAMKTKLRCNARKVNAGDFQYQATVVWLEGKAPPDYRTEAWYSDMQRTASCVRNKLEVTSHLFISSTREGVVQEYISFETGVIRLLDGDKGAALFSIENIWVCSGEVWRSLSDLDNQLLQDVAPVGSFLNVIVKVLPANKYSQLRYQAIIAWPGDLEEKAMPKEFEEKFNSRQRRMEMGKVLVKQYEMMKTVVKLNMFTSFPARRELVLVPVVLNLLPPGGTAFIKETGSSSDLGLISVTMTNPKDESQLSFYVLFHFEDVIDEFGVPAHKDKSISMKNLSDVSVDLTARSIVQGDNISQIINLTKKLHKDYPDAKIPILQAVKVFLKVRDNINTGVGALPTYLGREPASLNTRQPATAFYLNLSLRNRLDLKVLEFIDSCSSLQKNTLPTFFNPWFLNNKEVIKKEMPRRIPPSIELVDVHRNSKHFFGEFLAISVTPPKNPPAELSTHPAKVCLIHTDRLKPRKGLLEVSLDRNNQTFVYFSLKSVQSQQKAFGDLTNLMSVNMKDKVSVDAKLVDPKSKIPYVATAVWKTEENPPRKSGDLRTLTEDWKKVVPDIISEWTNKTIEIMRRKEDMEDSMKKAEEALSRAGGKEAKEVPKEKQKEPAGDPKQTENDFPDLNEENREWRWEPSFRDKLGTVHKVVNKNFALGTSYHWVGFEERRFFVLFDTTDVWINGEVLQKRNKTMPDAVSENDHIKFNAVHVATDNEWNLLYVATAVIVNKTQSGVREDQMPAGAVEKASESNLNPVKVATFKKVAEKLTKKPVPLDPNVEERIEIRKKKIADAEKFRQEKARRQEEERRRRKIEQDRQDRLLQKNAEEMEKKANDRRKELMRTKPEVMVELQGMEILRGHNRLYSCKLCGIQAMSLPDAESHINEEDHQNLKAEKEKREGTTSTMSRAEVEETLFLNEYKEIKALSLNGKRLYSCEKCRAPRLPLEKIKKHVTSILHKNNHKQQNNSAQLDQECKEMMKKGRVSVSYLCTPCGFTSDSVIATKNHIQEENHKKKTGNYCQEDGGVGATSRGKRNEEKKRKVERWSRCQNNQRAGGSSQVQSLQLRG